MYTNIGKIDFMLFWTIYNDHISKLESKVNDCLITGLRIIDSLLAIGRGQRQLILGDRYTGKTTIYLSLLLKCNIINIWSLDVYF